MLQVSGRAAATRVNNFLWKDNYCSDELRAEQNREVKTEGL